MHLDVNLTDGQTHQVSLYADDFDSTTRSQTYTIKDADIGAVLDTESLSNFQSGVYASWNLSGHVTIDVTNTTPGSNAVVGAVFFQPATAGATGTASFLGADTSTQGSWKGTYGSDGATIVRDPSSTTPSYATVTASGTALPTAWEATSTDPRALQTQGGSSRTASTFYTNPSGSDPGSFDLNANLTDGQSHQVALYATDFDNQGRDETVTVQDAATHATLDTEHLTNFGSGEYLVWNLTGDVNIHVANNSSSPSSNAVVSGLFFAPAGSPLKPAAPTNLTTTALPGEVDLKWTGSTNATGYNVYSSTDGGSTYSKIASNVTGTSYDDTSVTDDTNYSYYVTANNNGSESANSASQTATPGGVWQDLGNVTPSVSGPYISDYANGASLGAGTYRLTYVGGTMTYSNNPATIQGYRVNAFPDSPPTGDPVGDYGFKIAQGDTINDGGDIHAPDSGSITFQHTTAGPLGVYLQDLIYGDNQAGGYGGPTYKLERLVPTVSVVEIQDGSRNLLTPAIFQVTLSGGSTSSSNTVTIPYAFSGTAIGGSVNPIAADRTDSGAGTDYHDPTSGSVTISSGGGSAQVLVAPWYQVSGTNVPEVDIALADPGANGPYLLAADQPTTAAAKIKNLHAVSNPFVPSDDFKRWVADLGNDDSHIRNAAIAKLENFTKSNLSPSLVTYIRQQIASSTDLEVQKNLDVVLGDAAPLIPTLDAEGKLALTTPTGDGNRPSPDRYYTISVDSDAFFGAGIAGGTGDITTVSFDTAKGANTLPPITIDPQIVHTISVTVRVTPFDEDPATGDTTPGKTITEVIQLNVVEVPG